MGASKVEVPVPSAPGAHVTVFVIVHDAGRSDDLMSAIQSSLGFWDNPLDEAEWNET